MENCVNKLLKAFDENEALSRDEFADYIAFHGIGNAYNKRWLADIVPADVLKLSVTQAVNFFAPFS